MVGLRDKPAARSLPEDPLEGPLKSRSSESCQNGWEGKPQASYKDRGNGFLLELEIKVFSFKIDPSQGGSL